MPILGGKVGTRFLTTFFPAPPRTMDGGAYRDRSKLEALFGPNFWQVIQNRVVVDFGCGMGAESAEMARRGAARVYGLDIQERLLAIARQSWQLPNLSFGGIVPEAADIIICVDSFEHFANPEQILSDISSMLKPEGEVWVSFGPTWYHPLGGHLFSVFPWAHLLFSESSLCAWRKNFRSDGANRFCEVDGGLNQMTIQRFIRIVQSSSLTLEKLELVPIRRLKWMHNRLTREFLTATVRCRLIHRRTHAAGPLPVGNRENVPNSHSGPHLSSTTNTSPRQSVPTVQAAAPEVLPKLPIQSEPNMKNLPSCDT